MTWAIIHTGTFDQNSFHSTIHSAQGVAGISKEVKMQNDVKSKVVLEGCVS